MCKRKVKPISPKDVPSVELSHYDLNHIVEMINNQINKNHGMYPWEDAILEFEFPLVVRNAVAARFYMSGWTYIYHATTSELGQRSGLTSFILSTVPVPEIVTKHHIKYTRGTKTHD